MTDETWKALAIIVPPLSVLLGRLWSMVEHIKTGKAVKKTDKDIMEIKVFINGEMERKLQEAKEQGRNEERLKNQNDTL